MKNKTSVVNIPFTKKEAAKLDALALPGEKREGTVKRRITRFLKIERFRKESGIGSKAKLFSFTLELDNSLVDLLHNKAKEKGILVETLVHQLLSVKNPVGR